MTASAHRKSKKEFDPNKGYEELANSLIQIMEKGTNPFRRTWTAEQHHTNFVTGDPYQNGNLLYYQSYYTPFQNVTKKN